MNSPRQPGSPSSPVIYVVDDEQPMVDYAELALISHGYVVEKFTDPTHAYAAFTGALDKPSLLLTDYAMDPMNGLELSEKCKAAHPALKVVMLSGTVSEEFARSSPVRLDAFIAKPYQPGFLADTIRNVLRS